MESKASRYQSRIVREMQQHNDNPFSPPSSTGSHGTITLTSEISHIPEGESTRRIDDFSYKLPTQATSRQSQQAPNSRKPLSFNINTSVLGRTFPEWKGFNSHQQDDTEAKENVPPSPIFSAASFRTRAEMQPTVENESDSSVLSRLSAHTPENKDQAKNTRKDSNSRRGNANVTTLLETLKTAQTKKTQSNESIESAVKQSSKESSPKSRSTAATTPNAAQAQMDRRARLSSNNHDMSSGAANQTARSFFLPNLTYMNDFVSGALKWSSLRNGIPIFVKHGRVHDRETKLSADHHADFEGIAIPEEEEKIFVSLDKIRDEIYALKDHDELVSAQAEQLQGEVHDLQVQIAKFKSRKDSAMGSDSEGSMLEQLSARKTDLEEQVASLQARLEQANRKISINEIHTQSYVAERDGALRHSTEHVNTIRRLQSDLNAARAQLQSIQNENTQEINSLEQENEALRKSADEHLRTIKRLHTEINTTRGQLEAVRDINNTEGGNTLQLENNSLRSDNKTIRHEWKAMLEENQSLRSHNSLVSRQKDELKENLRDIQERLDHVVEQKESLQVRFDALDEEKAMLKLDNASLAQNNDEFFNNNKELQKKNSLLDRHNHNLQDEIERLDALLDHTEAETGASANEYKEFRKRVEAKNRELAKENAELQQQIIDMQAECSVHCSEHKQDRRRLLATNERLSAQLDQLSKRLSHLEVREISHETKASGSAHNTGRPKPVKVTRIVDPKGKNTVSEMSARTTTSQTDMPMQDDYTQQIDFNQEPQSYGILKNTKPSRLNSQKQRMTSTSTSARRRSDQDLTGRFSVKSGVSELSIPSDSAEEDVFHRPQSPSTRFELEMDHEDNMTSALFIDDITLETQEAAQKQKARLDSPVLPPPFAVEDTTLESHKKAGEKRKARVVSPVMRTAVMDDVTLESNKNTAEKQKDVHGSPVLTASAKRVLNNLCHDHECRDCIVCTRINSHRHEEDGTCSKKQTVRVDRPVPVTDRVSDAQSAAATKYEDEHTLRPSQDPALALAKVVKGLQDEEKHLAAAIAKKQATYDGCDASLHKRMWKKLDAEIQKLRKRRDLKRDQIYDLHDVLEGQKQRGQEMDVEAVDVTIMSVLSKDPTWNGIMDY
ncbi:Uu.00g026690.m01.CDS01 [Anthostomella pinea]|uniref:Uu.00g026690.m01.CDS01 n=1 Tax=Anthostomella pinea TaxID=933095 RepID=A0AAI8YCJ1_9PEZI|nr:Uu.00g026690.m01.CDS01 [Anthostomella pinea]